MWRFLLALMLIFFSSAACVSAAISPTPMPVTPLIVAPTASPSPEPTPTAPPTETAAPSPSPEPTLPPVVGPDPSYRVAAFYYPWYGTEEFDGVWIHWEQAGYQPPQGIGSDYYPLLGPYSSLDPQVVAQHFAWLREAGVGVIVSSWWGRGTYEDKALPLLLDIADDYAIKVAFHIEPYSGRSAERLVADIAYLYRRYGDHPAFFRTSTSSRWSPDDKPKGLFYIWSSGYPESDSPRVEPSYWRDALDAIHASPDGGLVLADETISTWVDGGHFDGLYNYGVLEGGMQTGYSWARGLPPEAWFVPGINPGFSATRINYPPELDTPRRDGDTYEARWEAALGVEVEPALVTVTTFNEWHEGTQIEPAAAGVPTGLGSTYKDYGALPPEGYLALTNKWVSRFLGATWPATQPIRVRLVTSSDWTVFSLISGASWLRPGVISVNGEAANAAMQDGRFVLDQPIEVAEAGGQVEIVADILLSGWESGGMLVFEIERGHLGATQVEFSKFVDDTPVIIDTFRWAGIASDERNAFIIQIPADVLFDTSP